MKAGSLLAIAILSLIAAAHLARLILQLEVTVGGARVPMWASGAAFLALDVIVVLLIREQRRA